jgi:hypothetical protein
MKVIDLIALAGVVVIAVVSFYRRDTMWLLIAAIAIAIWGTNRFFGFNL